MSTTAAPSAPPDLPPPDVADAAREAAEESLPIWRRQLTGGEIAALLAPALVALLAYLASFTSLHNGFVYDDTWIISTNPRMKELGTWWRYFGETYWPPTYQLALYRPLTILAYSIQWALGHGRPFIFHAMNVALYVTVSVAIYFFAKPLVGRAGAWVAAALFAVHPVHVEAVGNSVGQAELWTALVLLGAIALYLRWRAEGPLGWGRVLALTFLYVVASLFKEQGIVLIGLFVAAELTLLREGPRGETWREQLRAVRPLYLTMVLAAIGVILARVSVLGWWSGDNPHPVWVELTAWQRELTVVGTLVPEWARLIVWPARLLADYSPLDMARVKAPGLVLLPGLVILAGFAVLLAIAWRRSRVAAFGLLVFVVTMAPVSNVLFPTGVMVAERTLFFPSFGVLLAVGATVPRLLEEARASRIVAAGGALALALLLAAGISRSAARQLVWRSNVDTFLTLITDAPLDFRAHYGWGSELMARKQFASGEKEWRTAIKLYPAYIGVKFDLAHGYQLSKVYGPAVPLYREVVQQAPDRADARSYLVYCLLQLGRYDEARDEAIRGVHWGNSPETFRLLLARAYRGLKGLDHPPAPRDAGTGARSGLTTVHPVAH